MTLQEIENLTIEGNEATLMLRMVDLDSLLEGESPYSYPEGQEPSYSNLILNESLGSKPTLQDLQDELVEYKAELTAIEEARLAEIARKDDLKSRFKNLFDKRMANPGISNPDAHFRDEILNEEDKNLAESRMGIMEATDSIEKTKYENSQSKIPMDELRKERDEMLSSTDFTQLADAPMDSASKTEYRSYRTFLRELPTKIANQQWLEYRVPSFEEFKEL